jgi:GGDEF domain-containing protein
MFMVDIDQFERIGRAHGASSRERVAATIEMQLQAILRSGDWLMNLGHGRYVLAIDTSVHGVERCLSEAIAFVERRTFESDTRQRFTVAIRFTGPTQSTQWADAPASPSLESLR